MSSCKRKGDNNIHEPTNNHVLVSILILVARSNVRWKIIAVSHVLLQLTIIGVVKKKKGIPRREEKNRQPKQIHKKSQNKDTRNCKQATHAAYRHTSGLEQQQLQRYIKENTPRKKIT
jgi:hypothetical protein